MKFTVYQQSRPGKRKVNEDRIAHCYSRDAFLMVVADGMGGHYYGEIAAQIAVHTLAERFQREARPRIDDPFLFLQQALGNAHLAIVDFARTRRLSDSPRTTCVACLIQDNIAYWAHSGDSRLYLIRDEKVLFRTRDHSRVQILLDQGVINDAQAAVHPDRNRIYSCLGGTVGPELEFSRKTPLEAGDVLAVCTDGLWGVIPDHRIAAALHGSDLMEAVPQLLDQAEQEGGAHADNLSIVAVRWEDTYAEPSTHLPSTISTQTMPLDAVTTRMEGFDRAGNPIAELSDDEIEKAIEEIRATIQKYSK